MKRKIGRSLLLWLSFIPLAILNGGAREYVWNRIMPEEYSLPVSGLILSVLIWITTELLLPYLGRLNRKESHIVSGVWVFLTILFEFGFGISNGISWQNLAAAYNPFKGNLWLLVILTTGVAPIVISRRKLKNKN